MKSLKLLFVALGVMAASTVSATPTYVKFAGTEDVVKTNINIAGDIQSVSLGTYNIKTYQKGTVDSFTGFCVDPFQFTSRNWRQYEVSSLDPSDFVNGGADRYNNVQKLFDNAYDSLGGDNKKTAGFHLALWEIFVDDQDLGTSSVQTTDSKWSWWWGKTPGTHSQVEEYADMFLSSLDLWDVTNEFTFTFYQNDQYQDYLEFNEVPSAVPVPAALPLMASALGIFGIVRRRTAAKAL